MSPYEIAILMQLREHMENGEEELAKDDLRAWLKVPKDR